MFVIESAAHSHPSSLSSLEGCFGRFYSVYGAFDGEELIGFAIVQQIVDEVTLFDICISPSQQGRGLGKQLLNHLVNDAAVKKAVVVMLEVRASNHSAIGLYKKIGFIEAGRRTGYYPSEAGREDAILMDLQLNSGSGSL
nr:ribosomal protein S18-alanine N-acetyltransferase [Shewanella donghaensis]